MGAAIGELAQMPNTLVHDVTEYHSVSARVRNESYIHGAAVLLGLWLLLIICCTARMLRPTFAPSLGSYSTGRLLVSEPGLVKDHLVGELAQNPDITREFTRVGRPITGTPDSVTSARLSRTASVIGGTHGSGYRRIDDEK